MTTAYTMEPAWQDEPPTYIKVRASRMRPCVAVGRCAGQGARLPVVLEQRTCATPWLGIMSGL